VEVTTVDNGLKNIDLALKDGYTNSSGSLGFGLPSVKRIMDKFYIESITGKGTKILIRKWRKK